MTNWCHNRLSIVARASQEKSSVDAFVADALGPDLTWDEKGASPSKIPSTLCFHSLCPLRPSFLKQPYEPQGAGEELRQWGCHHGAFEIEFSQPAKQHAVYEFQTEERPPTNLLKTVTGKYDVTAYLSYYRSDGRRGRGLYFRTQLYALVQNESGLTKGTGERPENFTMRQELWLCEYNENHLEWVSEMKKI